MQVYQIFQGLGAGYTRDHIHHINHMYTSTRDHLLRSNSRKPGLRQRTAGHRPATETLRACAKMVVVKKTKVIVK